MCVGVGQCTLSVGVGVCQCTLSVGVGHFTLSVCWCVSVYLECL